MSARNSQRPESRASTTSAASHRNDRSAHDAAKTSHVAYVTPNPELALLSYQASLAPQAMPPYDAAQAAQQPPQHAHAHAHAHGHAPAPAPAHGHAPDVHFPVAAQYTAHDSPYMPQDMHFPGHVRIGSLPMAAVPDLHEDKRKKGSAVTATNDKELREMLAKNEGRPLREVAQEVIQKERTPMAEKTKQLFAMLWLRAVCKPAKTSVPRNRVYSQYATRCGTERVIPLNPASFGKLVRVIFPGIQTRRLGVRGESKYHYVDLALEEEQPSMPPAWQGNNLQMDRSQSTAPPHMDFNNIPRLQADTAAFPTTDANFDLQSALPPAARGPASKGKSFLYPEIRSYEHGTATAMTYSHTLRFPSSNIPIFTENEPVHLPPIQPFLPERTDSDTAEALAALYRTHCTSLIDSIRFCKEKQFFRLYTSFHGTLTVPVQKLFTHTNVAPWIEQCDLVMYRTMVRFVSRLTLQAAPAVVINILNNISTTLHAHIAKTFANQPPHVLDAKLRPATIFAGLLHRLIRVNQSAHAAANLLTIDQNREQMWQEWSTMVNPKRVMEAELPDCGYEEVHRILTTEMRHLLEPISAPSFEDGSFYNFEANNGDFAQYLQSHTAPPSRNGPSQVSAENVLDRWSSFISSLPARFPNAPARTILHCISTIGTAAIRDITIVGGLSYSYWWVLKMFMDEMALWLAEMGGFLEPTAAEVALGGGSVYPSPTLATGPRSQNGSRLSSMGAGAPGMGSDATPQSLFMPDPQQPGFAPPHHAQTHGLPFHTPQPTGGPKFPLPPSHDTNMDDSGIVMDDDFSKFGSHLNMEGMGSTDMRVDPL